MPNMRALATLAAIFVMTGPAFAASSQADWDKWEGGIRSDIQKKVDGIPILIKYRDDACPKQEQVSAPSVQACVRAYNVLIRRAEAEKAELELMLAASLLEPVERDKLLKIVPDPELRAFNNRTTVKFGMVWEMFPAPAKAAK